MDHVLCCWEHQAPSRLGKELSIGVCNETSHWDGWVTLHQWVKWNYSVSTGILLSCYKLDLLKCTISGTEHTPSREEQVKVLTWHILPPIHLLMSHSVAFPGQHVQYAQPGQVPKAAILPLLKARWTCSVFHWYDHLAAVFVPSIGLEDVIAHIEALAKSNQQTLNDSQQNLFLLNTELSLMRKAVLQNRMVLDIVTASQGCNGSIF